MQGRRVNDRFGRFAERIARTLGSPQFLVGLTAFIIGWFVLNEWFSFDPKYLVLNLLFSMMSSYAAPLIMLAQNRSEARDRTEIEHDRAVNRQAANDMAYLTLQIKQLRESLEFLPTRAAVREDVKQMGAELRESDALRR